VTVLDLAAPCWGVPEPDDSRLTSAVICAALAVGALLSPGTAAPLTGELPRITRMAEWTQTLSRSMSTRVPFTAGLAVPEATVVSSLAELTTAQQIQRAHGVSGLTWEQLARLFGVSRRSLHAWASGTRLSGANAERLAELSALLQGRASYRPDENRAWLLTASAGQVSRFDDLRRSRTRAPILDDALDVRERLGIR
jgi:DNA-binding transcriptional regulator YiaG